MDFKNKTAFITGAAVGIGRAAALKFAEKGANLVLTDINFDKLKEVKEELGKYSGEVLIFECDVRNGEEVNNIAKQAKEKFASVDILVNNAAIWRSFKPFSEVTAEEWRDFLDINILGQVNCINAVLMGMLEKGYGKIINVASVAGVYGNANMAPYSATKGALISMTKALAKEVADKGICVNSISPGSVSPAENPDIDYTEKSDLSFMGRTGSDAENANLICFLASDEAGYISGQNVQIDGCRKKQ